MNPKPSDFFLVFGFGSHGIGFTLLLLDMTSNFDFENWFMFGFIFAGVGLVTVSLIFTFVERKEKDIKK